MRLIFTIFILLASSACASENRIEYEGWVTDEFLKQVSEAPDGTTLMVSLFGDDLEQYSSLIDIVNSKNIRVHIVDYCLAGCANYLFPSVDRITSTDRALIGFSETYTFKWALFRDVPNYKGTEELRRLIELSEKEISLSDAYKNNPVYLVYPSIRRRYNCIDYDIESSSFPAITGELNYWSVSAEGLRELNGAYTSNLDMNKVIANVSEMEKNPRFLHNLTVKFESSFIMNETSIEVAAHLNYCD